MSAHWVLLDSPLLFCPPQAKPSMSLVRRRLPFVSKSASTMPSKLHDAPPPPPPTRETLGPKKRQLPYPAIMTGQCTSPTLPRRCVMNDKGSVAVPVSLLPCTLSHVLSMQELDYLL